MKVFRFFPSLVNIFKEDGIFIFERDYKDL